MLPALVALLVLGGGARAERCGPGLQGFQCEDDSTSAGCCWGCGQGSVGFFQCEDDSTFKGCWDKEFICDGHENACDDGSDEGEEPGQGCNLFPESGCRSSKGDRHWRCDRTGECFKTTEEAEKCQASTEPPPGPTLEPVAGCLEPGGREGPAAGCKEDEWKCVDGLCIPIYKLCDGRENCDDGSDESKNASLGCNRFCDPFDCPSLNGRNYSRCGGLAPEDPLVCTNLTVAEGDRPACRSCPQRGNVTMWRCDNGECIDESLRRDGKADCKDKSDERTLEVHWGSIVLATVVVVLVGILASYGCRLLNMKNVRNCFHCSLCSNDRKSKQDYSPDSSHLYMELKVPPSNELKKLLHSPPPPGANGAPLPGPTPPGLDQVDGRGDCPAEQLDELYPDSDIPLDLLELLDDKATNWEMRERDQVDAFLHNSRSSPQTLRPDKLLEAKKLYVQVHLDPLRYHHLYLYLSHRSPTVKELGKVTRQLLAWELELHGQDRHEVLKCWRLHLGASALTGMVINSVAEEPDLYSRCQASLYPARSLLRNLRRWVTRSRQGEDNIVHKYIVLARETLVPFIEASFFYFEQIKNLMYLFIVYRALYDMSEGRPTDHNFEFFLVVFMILGIVITQALFVWYSYIYAQDIFEVGHNRNECEGHTTVKIMFFKMISCLLSPLIPCYVLANHIFYESRLGLTRRHLQTVEDDLGDGADAAISDHEQQEQQAHRRGLLIGNRVKLYKTILRLERKALNYRKLYSYFRVTSAVLESVTQVVVIVLLMFVTGRRNRSIKLITGVEYNLKGFFGISDDGGIFSELNLMRDVVMFGSLVWSFAIILTALVKYWYQAKNLAVSFQGQVCLGIYFFFLSINRLTTIISLFATTQPMDISFDNGVTDPAVTLESAFVIFLLLVVVLRPVGFTLYKWHFSRNFRLSWPCGGADLVDRVVNVVVNCLVVTPYMVQTENIMVLKESLSKFQTPELQEQRRNSLKRKNSLLRINSAVDGSERQSQVMDSVAGIPMPSANSIIGPMLYDDLRKLILHMWWSDPTRKLDLNTVKEKLQENKKLINLQLNPADLDENIRVTLENLEFVGMVNKPLLNPVQTKREYFWLFLFVILENMIALGIEVGNGGVMVSQGHYYSWDVRLGSLALAILALVFYYSKYHLTKDIMTSQSCGGWLVHLPVCLCCWSDTGITAPPNEDAMERMMSKDDTADGRKGWSRTIQTQTSLTELLASDLPPPPWAAPTSPSAPSLQMKEWPSSRPRPSMPGQPPRVGWDRPGERAGWDRPVERAGWDTTGRTLSASESPRVRESYKQANHHTSFDI